MALKKTLFTLVFVLCFAATATAADTLQIVIMSASDPRNEGPKYQILSSYIQANATSIGDIQLRIAKNYPEAALLFKSGLVDGMFAGSFVAAIFIKKDLARPVVRPLSDDGTSTYKGLVVAREKTKPFSGLADFKGKRVAYSALASSGEIYVRSLLAPGQKPEQVYTPVVTPNHQAALMAVQNGAADYAVVKNTIWDPAKYPGLAVVGSDDEVNPENTLIMTGAAFSRHGEEIRAALLKLAKDTSEKAVEVRKAFGCKGFIDTSVDDFNHTFLLIQKAHIDPVTFDFSF